MVEGSIVGWSRTLVVGYIVSVANNITIKCLFFSLKQSLLNAQQRMPQWWYGVDPRTTLSNMHLYTHIYRLIACGQRERERERAGQEQSSHPKTANQRTRKQSTSPAFNRFLQAYLCFLTLDWFTCNPTVHSLWCNGGVSSLAVAGWLGPAHFSPAALLHKPLLFACAHHHHSPL